MPIQISDHALVRFMERCGGLDVEALREAIARSLERATVAAALIGGEDYTIRVDGLIYRVRSGVVVTVVNPAIPKEPQ